jgi:hypothetical protein
MIEIFYSRIKMYFKTCKKRICLIARKDQLLKSYYSGVAIINFIQMFNGAFCACFCNDEIEGEEVRGLKVTVNSLNSGYTTDTRWSFSPEL